MISRDYYLLSTKYQCFTRGFGLSNESVSKVFLYIYLSKTQIQKLKKCDVQKKSSGCWFQGQKKKGLCKLLQPDSVM